MAGLLSFSKVMEYTSRVGRGDFGSASDGYGSELFQVAQATQGFFDYQGNTEADGTQLSAGGHLQ